MVNSRGKKGHSKTEWFASCSIREQGQSVLDTEAFFLYFFPKRGNSQHSHESAWCPSGNELGGEVSITLISTNPSS
jgi:hypothetical protein